MPMYDYGCDECGYTKEILTSLINDKPLKPGSYRGRKNTSPEKIIISNGEKHA